MLAPGRVGYRSEVMKPVQQRDQIATGAAPDGIRRDLAARPEQGLSPVEQERRILAFMGETKRVGRWLVPRLFRVRAMLAEVRVDLRDNEIPRGFTLDVNAVGSRVTVIVPPGVNVAFDVFALVGNAINNAHEPVTSDAASTAIRVVGSVVLGEVRVLVKERGV